jgi:predicted transcriptional regulator
MDQVATLLRLRRDVREMLDKAAENQRRSRVSIAEQAIREYCRQHETASDKMQRLINAKL